MKSKKFEMVVADNGHVFVYVNGRKVDNLKYLKFEFDVDKMPFPVVDYRQDIR